MRKFLVLLVILLVPVLLPAADISGTWSAAVQLDAGSGTATFALKQSGESLSGTYSGALGSANVTGTVKGSVVEWTFDNPDAGKIVYKGKLEGNSKMSGTVEYGQLGKGTFTAEKK